MKTLLRRLLVVWFAVLSIVLVRAADTLLPQIASDFAITAVQSALEEVDRWAPAGDPKHFWLATQDLLPGAVPLMEGGYIDVSTTYDAYKHSEELVRVVIALSKGEDPKCGPEGCLAKGRVVTPATIGTIENLWSKTYK